MQSDDPLLSPEPSPAEDELSPENPHDALLKPSSQGEASDKTDIPQTKARRADGPGRSEADARLDASRNVREPIQVSYRSRELSLADQVLLFIAEVGTVWKRSLRWVRSQLPSSWQAALSDEILSAILLGALFLLLALWHPLGGSKRSVAEGVPASPGSSEISMGQDESAAAELTGPSELIGQPTASEAPPVAALSPEDARILEVQEQVSEITQAYADGLIRSVRANFRQGALFVNLGSGWYDLARSQQDQLAQDIYRRSQDLTFERLYLLDAAAIPVARNPVVGSQMIILQRAPVGETELKELS